MEVSSKRSTTFIDRLPLLAACGTQDVACWQAQLTKRNPQKRQHGSEQQAWAQPLGKQCLAHGDGKDRYQQ
ncbi:hypothetical protein D3C80_1605780 [compost metagenome]